MRVELVSAPASVRAARRLTTAALVARGRADLAPVAAQLVSELATNAVLHAHSSFLVEVAVRHDVVRIGVSDRSPVRPQRKHHGVQAGTGRGLGLVEVLSAAWGVDDAEAPWRKTVWFELPLEAARLADPAEGALLVSA